MNQVQPDVELRLAVRQRADGVPVPDFLKQRAVPWASTAIVSAPEAARRFADLCLSFHDGSVLAESRSTRRRVRTPTGPLLILAGAGSGKTRVITTRIGHLICHRPRRARRGARGHVHEQGRRGNARPRRAHPRRGLPPGRGSPRSIRCAARLLRREAPAIGLSRDFVIYDSSDQLSVVKQAMKSMGIDDKLIQPRAALSRISQAKNRMEGPEEMKSSGWSLRDQQITRIYEAYRRALTDAGALDFDDLLLKTVELFETVERVRDFYARKFKYVLVDEYQDTNRPQYLLIRRLAAVHRNLCVVGDPDQSIYRWRGADLRNILDFEHDFSDARIVKLEQNYRSTQVILDAASAVISRNRNRKDKKLWTEQQGGARIVYYRAGDEIEEADFITRGVREAQRPQPEAMTAVLYRTNAQSRAIEDALMREGVAYRIIGGVRFYERKEIKDALAYLRLLINPHDDVSFRRVVNVPSRGIGRTRHGGARGDRSRRPRGAHSAVQRGLAAGAVTALAVGPHAGRARTARDAAAGADRAQGLPRHVGGAHVGRRRHVRLDHDGLDAGSIRLPARSAGRAQRGSRGPH